MTRQEAALEGYRFICGVCGWYSVNKPGVCHCGNDVEFDRLPSFKEASTK